MVNGSLGLLYQLIKQCSIMDVSQVWEPLGIEPFPFFVFYDIEKLIKIPWYYKSMKDIFQVLCVLLALHQTISLNCNATNFHFTSKYTLGKQEQLNKTFTKIQQKITSLNDVVYNPTPTYTYTISKVNPSFYYRDTKQKAKITGGDVMVIDGGYLEVDFTFEWEKKFLMSQRGTGSARGLSNQVIIAKKLIVGNGSFYVYELLDSLKITFRDSFELTRIDPADTTVEDRKILQDMINNIQERNVRFELEDEIQKYYASYLNETLLEQKQPIEVKFDYKWVPTTPGKQNVTIPMIRRPIAVDIEPEGIKTQFEIQVENDTNWKCGERSVPFSPFDPRTFGGSQEFMSYDYYQGVLRYAIEKNLLNTDLNRQSWQSRMFQFYVGDLYEIFPALQNKFFAYEPVAGSCRPTYNRLSVQNAGKDTFAVFINFDCSLEVMNKEKFVDFAVDLNLTVGGVPKESSIDFKLRGHNQTTKFYPYGQYRIQNQELAQEMVKFSLNRLYEGNLFGSGFPLYPARDYPQFLAQTNFTVVYDSTHVNMYRS